jgi:hypothetical protein
MKHKEPPEREEKVPAEVLKQAEAITQSGYFAYVGPLAALVRGAVVTNSAAGPSGFILFLDTGHWVCSAFAGERVEWAHDSGEPPPEQLARLTISGAGDGRAPLAQDYPYASERCEIEAEVGRSLGHRITGLACGEACFNFCFDNGYELETMLVPTDDGQLSLRVFWERWS